MKIVRSKYLPPSRRHAAINLFGIFFVHPNVHVNERLINHERIHTAQMRELLYIPFYLIYLIEWLLRLVMKDNAYLSIGEQTPTKEKKEKKKPRLIHYTSRNL